MKRLIFFIMVLFMAGCGTYRNATTVTKAKNVLDIQKDENQYDLVVLDPGFQNWFDTNWSPAKDHMKSYYDSWNDQYVSAWNYKATHIGYSNYFDSVIDYNPNTDYGMAVSRKLYYYFRYVELVKKIQILDYKRPSNVM